MCQKVAVVGEKRRNEGSEENSHPVCAKVLSTCEDWGRARKSVEPRMVNVTILRVMGSGEVARGNGSTKMGKHRVSSHRRRGAWAILGGAAVAFGCHAELGSIGGDGPAPGDGTPGTGGAGIGPGPGQVGTGGVPGASGGGTNGPVSCVSSEVQVGRAPLRRLTRFEYNNTVQQLLGDTSSPGNSLPPELLGNGFGNDADAQPVSSFYTEQLGIIAEKVAERALGDAAVMGRYAPCFASVNPGTEAGCARTFIENFATKAYRRPLEASDIDDLVQLQQQVAELTDYRTSLATVVEAVLQSPDFLYRIEFGDATTQQALHLKPTGHEMATRLSYFFWAGPPDDELERAAAEGELATADGVVSQAQRLLNDPRARTVVRFFFSRFLPIEGLTDLARDPAQYPTFTPQIGALMRRETDTFLEHEIFEGPGDWRSILTAPYTFVNETLAGFYGIEGVSGDTFQKVNVDPTRRKGLLTHGSVLTGTTVSNFTNPVRRGVFILRNMMCVDLPHPPESLAASIFPPDPYSGKTGRERYSAHSKQAGCAACHSIMDPPGFALENYDAVGLWRDQENDVTIDASGDIPGLLDAPFSGPLELIDLIANDEKTHACFADMWLTFAAGRSLSAEDVCLKQKLEADFAASGYSIKELLLNVATSDAFLYMPSKEMQ